jgi:hypothetical protein
LTQIDSDWVRKFSHEIELVVHFPNNGFGEAFFTARGLLLFAAGGAAGLGIKEGLAFETAGGAAGQGVEHAQEVERVLGEKIVKECEVVLKSVKLCGTLGQLECRN